MITASALRLYCGYPRALEKVAPTTAKERDAAARKQAGADKGTMFHEAIQAWQNLGELQMVADLEVWGWLQTLAMSWYPAPHMLLELPLGLRPDMTGVRCSEPMPHEYVAVDDSELLTAGRADAVWTERSPGGLHIVHVRDWKTGRWPVAPVADNPQATMLALAACSVADADGFVREIYYARDGHCDADAEPVLRGSYDFSRCELMVRVAARLDDEPKPGSHCEPCWERRMKRCQYAQQPDERTVANG